ncbi:MAG: glycosyltransferase family 2 protein [Lachnospiraceae bacterium]|nr:glycosyltransferase family 2 protein [Lachnospiraceae bacterium]
MKKVSVIIPCYNVEKFVDRCMKYLTEQTIGFEENVEVIMVDDCSTDGTLAKLQEYEKKYPENICLIPLEQNMKQGAARNIAIEYATGEYVCYQDADDYLVPNALEKLYRAAKQNRAEITGYLFKYVFEGRPDDVTDTKSGKPDEMIEINSRMDRIYFIFSDKIIRGCWNKFYEREFILKNKLRYAEGIFDEESLFTYPAYMAVKRYYILNEYLYRYYQNQESTCYNLAMDASHRDDNARCWLELYFELKAKGFVDEYPREMEMVFIHNYFFRSFMYSARRDHKYTVARVKEMQETVNELFPDYRNNPYKTKDPNGLIMRVYPTLWADVNEGNIDKFNDYWKKVANLEDMGADFRLK